MPECIFTVTGQPQGKGRPRFVSKGRDGKPLPFVKTYTPKATIEYEDHIRTCYLEVAKKCHRVEVPVTMILNAYYKIPKSASKKDRQSMLDGDAIPTVKPDLDNVEKAVLDALNGFAFADDKQIWKVYKQKTYSDNPRVVVCLRWEEPSC